MSLVEAIKNDRMKAMKKGETFTLSVLRLLLAELDKERVTLKLSDVSELSDEQVQAVVGRQLKKLDKEIEAYVNAGHETGSQEYEKELLQSYLPEQATEEEIVKLIHHALSLVERGEINNPMQYLSQRLRGKADMKQVSEAVKKVQQSI